MVETQELIFEFSIQAVHQIGGITFEPTIFNQGVPMEFVIVMVNSWSLLMMTSSKNILS